MSYRPLTLACLPPGDECPAALCCRQFYHNALFFAITRGDSHAVGELLEQDGIDVNSSGPKNQPPLFTALEYQRYDIMEALLNDPRVNGHITDGQGRTVLHLAVIYDDHLAVQVLLKCEAIDVDSLSFAGDSALLLAAKTYDGLESRGTILDLLISHPTSVLSQRDAKGRSLLWHAANTSNERLVAQLGLSPLELSPPPRSQNGDIRRVAVERFERAARSDDDMSHKVGRTCSILIPNTHLKLRMPVQWPVVEKEEAGDATRSVRKPTAATSKSLRGPPSTNLRIAKRRGNLHLSPGRQSRGNNQIS